MDDFTIEDPAVCLVYGRVVSAGAPISISQHTNSNCTTKYLIFILNDEYPKGNRANKKASRSSESIEPGE